MSVVVSKSDEQVVAVDGRTHEHLASGAAGEDDGRVLRAGIATLDDGGQLFVRSATYRIDTPSERTGDGALYLRGSGVQVVSDYATLRFGDHTPGTDVQKDLKLFGATNALVSGLILDGNRENRGTPTQTVNVSESRNVTFRDCVVHGGSAGATGDRGYGVAVSRSEAVTLDNCVVRDAERHGVHPGGQADARTRDVLIRGCTFLGNGDHPTGSAVDVRSHTHDCTVERCRFERNGRAVKLKGPDVRNVRLAENVIRDNYLETDTERGQVMVRTERGADGIECVGNRFLIDADAADRTVHVRYRSAHPQGTVRIAGNRMVGGTAGVLGAGEAPIETFLFTDNVVEDPRGPPAAFRHVGTLLMRDNLFRREGPGGEGVTIGASVDGGVIADNVLVNVEIRGTDAGFEVFDNSSV